MEFINFYGHRKTTPSFLKKVASISRAPEEVVRKLKSLSIYDTITPTGHRVALDESPNSLRMKITSAGKKYFSGIFPNIFGKGDRTEMSYSSDGDAKIMFGFPLCTASKLLNNRVEVSRTVKEYNDKKLIVKKAEASTSAGKRTLSLGAELINKLPMFYGQLTDSILGCRLVARAGVSKTAENNMPFLKLAATRDIACSAGPLFFHSVLRLGRIFGRCPLTERFFLGPEIRGYKEKSISSKVHNKKIGGSSIAALSNRLGVRLGGMELFLFGDIGVNSVHGLAGCYEVLRTAPESNCIGKSIGVGASMKNHKGVSVFYSVPLTRNPEVEKYGFNVDVRF